MLIFAEVTAGNVLQLCQTLLLIFIVWQVVGIRENMEDGKDRIDK